MAFYVVTTFTDYKYLVESDTAADAAARAERYLNEPVAKIEFSDLKLVNGLFN